MACQMDVEQQAEKGRSEGEQAGYNRERSSNNDEVEEVATCLTQTTNTSE